MEHSLSLQFSLGGKGGCDNEQVLSFSVRGKPLGTENTDPVTGKTAAVHFLSFDFTPEQRTLVQEAVAGSRTLVEAVVAVGHPNYTHTCPMPTALLNELVHDFAVR